MEKDTLEDAYLPDVFNNSQYSAFFRANQKEEKLRPKPKYWRDYL